jgi:hypothetical protein
MTPTSNTFIMAVGGAVAAIVGLFVFVETRHRKAEAERRAAEARRMVRQRAYLDANAAHVAAFEKERNRGQTPAGN